MVQRELVKPAVLVAMRIGTPLADVYIQLIAENEEEKKTQKIKFPLIKNYKHSVIESTFKQPYPLKMISYLIKKVLLLCHLLEPIEALQNVTLVHK